MKRLICWALNVLFPLALGSLIYLFYRPTTLLIFTWLDLVPFIKKNILVCRDTLHYPLNSFIVFSLPTGLWSYAAHFSIFQIWKGDKSICRYIWISVFILMVYFSEIGQGIGIIRGTFDLQDLFVLVCSTLIAFIATLGRRNEQ